MGKNFALVLLVTAAAACGSDGKDKGGTDANTNGPDAFQFRDAPATQTVMVTVSGQATERTMAGSTAAAGVLIEAFRNADENTALASTMTDAQGNYTITVQTNGESIDGFLKATRTDYKTTYLYPPFPLMMNYDNAPVIMVTPQTYETLSNVAQGGQLPGEALVALVVTDGTNPIAGATVSSTPMGPTMTRYNAMAGTVVFPSATATSTYTDGIAYLFRLPPGQVTVSAMKTGMTFASHGLKAWADEVTTTVIVP